MTKGLIFWTNDRKLRKSFLVHKILTIFDYALLTRLDFCLLQFSIFKVLMLTFTHVYLLISSLPILFKDLSPVFNHIKLYHHHIVFIDICKERNCEKQLRYYWDKWRKFVIEYSQETVPITVLKMAVKPILYILLAILYCIFFAPL